MLGRMVWAIVSTLALAALLFATSARAVVPNPATDLNGDGIVNTTDLVIVGNCLRADMAGAPLPPECPATDPHPAGAPDGDWDMDDLFEVQTNLGQTFPIDDDTPPVVGVAMPADGATVATPTIDVAGTVDDGSATISLTVTNDQGTQVIAGTNDGGGTYDVFDVPLAPGVNSLTVTATDRAGNAGAATIQITYVPDVDPPVVSIESPADGATLTTDRINVSGTVGDDVGVASVTVNGFAAMVSNGTFSVLNLELVEGANGLTATAIDLAGKEATDAISVTYAIPPVVTITAPAAGALLRDDRVDVTGVVDDPTATVEVNGIPADAAGGVFEAFDVPLSEGYNRLTARATDATGVTGSDAVDVRRDTTRPVVTIETPQAGAVLTSLQVDVAGLVNDQSTNINIDEEDVSVTVNGVPAMVSQRAWVIPDMLLQRGLNTLEVVATDAAGNSRTTEVQVEVQDRAGQRLRMLAGNAQAGGIGTRLPEPLVVTLVDANGDPVPGKPVRFEVSRGEGVLNTANGDATEATLETDDNGLVSISYTLGNRAGAGNHRVRATAPGFLGQVEYCFAAITAVPERITTVSGDHQDGIIGQPLRMPFKVLVNDSGGNPVQGVDVTFALTDGGGDFDGQGSTVVTTDNDGYAEARFTLGPEVGVNNQVVTASFEGLAESPATFTASGRVPATATSFTGLVVDNQDLPIEGVTVRLALEAGDTFETTTDDQGRFALEAVGHGPGALVVDGATALREGSWIRLTYEVDLIANIENTVGMPIYLLPVAPNATVVQNGGPEQDIVLTMPDMPGAEVTVKAHSVTCPPGMSECVVSWTQINAERMAMPPPMGSVVMLGWTLQPTGARFDPPVDICIPNMDMPPGMQVEMFNWDYGLGDWAAVGTATVTEDGSQLCSDPGFGIPSAGWGCCVPPPPPCTSACSDCGEAPECNQYERQATECGGCTCVLKPSADGPAPQTEDAPGDCRSPYCRSGSVALEPNDSDIPEADVEGDCKKPGCENGSPTEEDDDGDIADDDAKCNRCAGGQIEPDPAKEGQHCGDGTERQACLTCKEGRCEPPECPVDASGDQVFRLSRTQGGPIQSFLDKVRAVVNRIPNISVRKISLDARGEIRTGERCCEDCRMADPVSDFYRANVNGTLEVIGGATYGPTIDINQSLAFRGYGINAAINAYAGVRLEISARGQAGAAGQVLTECIDFEGCVLLTGGADISFRPTVGVEIQQLAANVLWAGSPVNVFDVKAAATGGGRIGRSGVTGNLPLAGNNCPDSCSYTLGAIELDVKVELRLIVAGYEVLNPPSFTYVYVVWGGLNGPC